MRQDLPYAATLAANLYHHLSNNKKVAGAVVADDKTATIINDALKLLEIKSFVLPDIKARYGEDLRSYSEELLELNEVLSDYYKNGGFLIAPAATISKFLPAKSLYDSLTINFGDQLDLNNIKEKLIGWGYEIVDVVEQKGEASFRGEVIDIYGVGMEDPIRILLDLDLIESIRLFDPATQKSEQSEHESVTIYPALFALDSDTQERLSDLVVGSDFDSFFKDAKSLGFWFIKDIGKGENLLANGEFIRCGELDLDEIYSDPIGLIDKKFFEELKELPIVESVKALKVANPLDLINFHSDKQITIALNSDAQMRANGLDLASKKYRLLYTDAALSLLTQSDLIVSLNKTFTTKKKRKRKPKIMLDELSVGDFVVHENYGVGRFSGLEQVSLLGGAKDFVVINYAGEDKLLIPVENLYLIDRYIADGLPVVDKLGKGSFTKLKEGAKAHLYEIASEIVKRAAEREVVESAVIELDQNTLESFQNGAGFDYTPDQARAINEIFNDLASGKVMDRLLSGDVGFGKTEVAMNAIFATVKSGLQAALIVPTTLLSNQHYQSLKERFLPYNITVGRLDRYTTPNQKKTLLAGLKDGSIPVVVGTHALLGTEIKNLALMVVDEEHKFGVKQKEALKDKAKNLHLLSMSATPIPRSLNMALSQIKGFSEILTPPKEREAVRTVVKESDPKVIKEAILRELRRGGQCFYVFNSIAEIECKKDELLEILPELKILILHSKVSSTVTEQELIAFVEGRYNLLLSTTIIESGIHMPNVNTIIIDGADRFGIADLHQLRGRVGRSSRTGYCYFLVEAKESLTDDAKKRLIALENNSHLGSGTALAFHDLEIRGGGNILGASQSGHIKHIGYSLYLKMLEDALAELNNAPTTRHDKPVDLRLSVKAFIDEATVSEERLRLELYRRFANTKTVAEVYELEEEMIDRFGTIGANTRSFIDLMAIKILAQERGIAIVQSYEMSVTFTLADGTKTTINSPSKDDDDIIKTALKWLKS